ncbi:MAG: c-type cytochrome [Vulcanimicrobiaceae bacterium]
MKRSIASGGTRAAGARTAFFVGALLLAGCSAAPTASDAVSTGSLTVSAAVANADADAQAEFPPGEKGRLIVYGHDLFTKTPALAGKFVTAGMSCEACHLDAGRKAHAGSLLGIYAQFPQWNKRSHRFIALQDRIAECFLYSMNGRPPAYDSREMIALTAYIAFLSKGARVGYGFPGQGLVAFKPEHTPSVAAGGAIFGSRCAACHGANGDGGTGGFPPLWGAKSFNNGAGMHRLGTMAAFVRYNMPFGSPPNTLGAQEAYDVSAFVLSHPRPQFAASRTIAFPPQPARSF